MPHRAVRLRPADEHQRFPDDDREHRFPTNVVAIDHSGGPADGYIYVVNDYVTNEGESQGEVEVFAPTGRFLGTIDESQVTPDTRGMGGPFGNYPISMGVASNGVIYILVPSFSVSHVDRYVPIDGNPAHDDFAGQIRAACANSVCIADLASYRTGAPALNYYYTGGSDATHGANSFYARFPIEEFFRQGEFNFAVSDIFSPDVGPFGNGGFYPPFNTNLTTIAVDPGDQHAYIGTAGAGIQEWTEDNHQVGPIFAVDHAGPRSTRSPSIAPGARTKAASTSAGRTRTRSPSSRRP